jgi:uncharacterized phosphatase
MIVKKEFYFVRHGETDHNISKAVDKGDHAAHIPLNATGRGQAMAIEPLVAKLPVKTICASPMKRAQETKEIITVTIDAPHHAIEGLGECSSRVWQEMRALGMYSQVPGVGEAALFMRRVGEALNQALALPGPVLVVAHGGVHWAACCLMGVDRHEWSIGNCGIVHFQLDDQGNWAPVKVQ